MQNPTLNFELSVDQANEVYRNERRKRTRVDVECALERFRNKLSDEEIEKAIDKALVIQDNDIYYVDMAEQAIYEVLRERCYKATLQDQQSVPASTPHPYGMTFNEMLKVYEYASKYFRLNKIQDVLATDFAGEELTAEEMDDAAAYALTIRENQTDYDKIAHEAIQMVLDERTPKPQPPDLLGETLKRIGLETNQHFNVDDPEWKGFEFYVDSFGDLYVVSGDTNEFANHDFQPEYLTLGRILTQYPDKVVPM